MAERRLFSKKITESDAFLDMPLSAQCLYFHLNMNADDDGFVANPKMIQRMIGASNDDAKLLISKNFLINFDNGIVVVKHWCIHNIIQKDRYKPTEYVEEKSQLYIKENKSYTLDATQGNKLIGNKLDTKCIQNGNKMETQVKLSKVKLSKDNIYKKECEEKSIQENYDFLKNIPKF